MAEVELEDTDKGIISELSKWFDAQELMLDGLHYKVKDYYVLDKKAEELAKTLAIGTQDRRKYRGYNMFRVFQTEGFKDDIAPYFVIPIRIREGNPTAGNHPLSTGKALQCTGAVQITPHVDILIIYFR